MYEKSGRTVKKNSDLIRRGRYVPIPNRDDISFLPFRIRAAAPKIVIVLKRPV